MSRLLLLAVVLLSVFQLCGIVSAQNLCPTGTASDKLVCVIPQAFGINGIQVAKIAHQGHFEESFLSSSFGPLDSSIARQVTLLPQASPSSGLTFSWDSAAKVFVPSTDSFGPVLSDRAETIGKYKVFLGFDYQYFDFKSIDGISLRNLPVVLTHQDDSADGPSPGPPPPPVITCSINPPNSLVNYDGCGFVRDVISTVNSVDLKIHQFTTFVTFGLTNRIDVSVAIPIENVRLGVASIATIHHNDSPSNFDHTFATRPGCPPPNTSNPCLSQSFTNFRAASGIGDITLRVKGTAWKGEHAGLAVGADIRLPSGDSQDFLGAGAAGVKPFFIWSYRARVSPHTFVGYETNGSSVIAGDITTGQKARLPGDLSYSAGADVWLTKRFTVAADLVGQQIFEARRTTLTTFTELGQCQDNTNTTPTTVCDQNLGPLTRTQDTVIGQATNSYNATNLSVGLKAEPMSSFLITANVLIKLNNGGLRARLVPLIGLSYAF